MIEFLNEKQSFPEITQFPSCNNTTLYLRNSRYVAVFKLSYCVSNEARNVNETGNQTETLLKLTCVVSEVLNMLTGGRSGHM